MLKKIILVIECEWKVLWNSKAALIGQLLIEPLAYTALLGAGIQGLVGDVSLGNGLKIPYLSFAYPGILCVQMIRLFGRAVYRITVERRWGLYALKTISGIGSFSYWLGMTVVPFSIFLVQSTVVYLFVFVLGVKFSLLDLATALLLSFSMVAFWSSLAILITLAIKNYQQRDLIINLSLLPLMFGAPLFYPLETVPHYLKIISFLNPLTYQVTVLRKSILGLPLESSGSIHLVLFLLLFGSTLLVLKRAEPLASEH